MSLREPAPGSCSARGRVPALYPGSAPTGHRWGPISSTPAASLFPQSTPSPPPGLDAPQTPRSKHPLQASPHQPTPGAGAALSTGASPSPAPLWVPRPWPGPGSVPSVSQVPEPSPGRPASARTQLPVPHGNSCRHSCRRCSRTAALKVRVSGMLARSPRQLVARQPPGRPGGGGAAAQERLEPTVFACGRSFPAARNQRPNCAGLAILFPPPPGVITVVAPAGTERFPAANLFLLWSTLGIKYSFLPPFGGAGEEK